MLMCCQGSWGRALIGVGLGLLLASCGKGAEDAADAAPDDGTTRSAAGASSGVLVGSEGFVPTPTKADPVALAELLRAAPDKTPSPTGPDGGTLVGSETEVEPTKGSPDEVAAGAGTTGPGQGPRAALRAGRMELRPQLSNVAIERAAREQIYWRLVQKCRDGKGEILPPDSITLVFTIRTDGSIDPASVGATAADKRYRAAAECVVREFSAIPFRGPEAALDQDTRVIATLPSVD